MNIQTVGFLKQNVGILKVKEKKREAKTTRYLEYEKKEGERDKKKVRGDGLRL